MDGWADGQHNKMLHIYLCATLLICYLFSFKYHLFYLHVGLPAFDISVQLLHKIKTLFSIIYVLSLDIGVSSVKLHSLK